VTPGSTRAVAMTHAGIVKVRCFSFELTEPITTTPDPTKRIVP